MILEESREGVSWRSFWNGTDGPDGPISKRWNIQGWPTIYILSPRGTVRYKQEGYGPLSEKLLNHVVDRVYEEFFGTRENKRHPTAGINSEFPPAD